MVCLSCCLGCALIRIRPMVVASSILTLLTSAIHSSKVGYSFKTAIGSFVEHRSKEWPQPNTRKQIQVEYLASNSEIMDGNVLLLYGCMLFQTTNGFTALMATRIKAIAPL
jgi:hypothetical protein